MKEEILKLRNEGKTYNQIKEILGCSKGTIAYHCGDGQKEKSTIRRKKRRENILLRKVDGFKYKRYDKELITDKVGKNRKDVVESIRKFQKRENGVNSDGINKEICKTFNWEDVLEKFGENTVCYLSGEEINLYENNYQLDHIKPASRKGNNSLDNLGITHKVVNYMKGNLTPEELFEWCSKILKHNGYNVTKK